MKIKNNKGFAITALLYGLSIMALMTVVLMMSIMQNSRKNNTTTVKAVEQELNNYGSTTTNYSGATSTPIGKTIPSGQTGYYKMELCGSNGNLVTGTVYLPEGTNLSISLGTTSSVTVDGNLTMSDEPYVNGMARFYKTKGVKKYPFLNGQVIKDSGCDPKPGFKMSKVSNDKPIENNNYFNSVKSITTDTSADIYALTYNPNSTDAPTLTKNCTSTTSCSWTNALNISDIYIDYKAAPGKKTNIKIGTNTISLDSDYSFAQAGYSFSRFGPVSGTTIQNGNYVISLASKTASSVYSISQKDVLSTSTYTPPDCHTANATTNTSLIHYGHESLGRPVLLQLYTSRNGQKWRFEYMTENEDPDTTYNYYKITEIEEYKPFEVHKNDDAVKELGPILMCGEYVCDESGDNIFKSTDSYRKNPNQKWELTPTGLGTYRFRTNANLSGITQYLYYDSAAKRFYVTDQANEASLFYIYNANL